MTDLFDLPCNPIRIIWTDPASKFILAVNNGQKNIAVRLGTLISDGAQDLAQIGAVKHHFLDDPRIVDGRIKDKGYYAIFFNTKKNHPTVCIS